MKRTAFRINRSTINLCCALLVGALSSTEAQPVARQPKQSNRYKTMTEAMSALSQAKDEDSKQDIYSAIGRLPLETPTQLLTLYDEIAGMENKVQRLDQQEYVRATQYLSRVFLTAKDPKFSEALADALNKEYKSTPKDFLGLYGAKTELDMVRFSMRQARLEALAQAVGQSKDRVALPTLHKMLESKGADREVAIKAIGQFGDPADIDEFVQRVKRDPKGQFNLNNFGPAAVDPIMRAVDDPTTSDSAKGVLISSLRYMGTQENRSTYRQLLHHKYGRVQEMAAMAICSTAGKGDGDTLIEIARSRLGTSRILAVRAMGKEWDTGFIPVLRNILLHDNSPIVRAETSQVLADHKVKEAADDLKRNLNDRDGEVRRAAEKALKQLQ